MKKIYITGFLAFFLGVNLAVIAGPKLKVLEIKAPAVAAPGQKVAAHATFEVLEVDPPNRLRPFASYNLLESKQGKNIPAGNMTPWKLENYKVGDKLKVTANFVIPEKAVIGEKAVVAFKVVHNRQTLKLVGSDRQTFKITAPGQVKLSPIPAAAIVNAVQVVPMTDQTAVIDGKLDETVWQKAAVIPVLVNSATGKKAGNPAELRIFSDSKKLYIALKAFNVDPKKIQVRKFDRIDSPIWNNDALEIFLTPDMGDGDYAQFTADLLNQHYDSLNGDFHGFNPPWQSAAVRNADNWIIEAAIPLDAVSREKVVSGTVWRGGFFRLSQSGTVNSAWVPTMGTHNGVKKHGWLVFGNLGDALDKAAGFVQTDPELKVSEAMKKIYAEAKNICNGSSRSNPGEFVRALNKLGELKSQCVKLQFAEKFSASKSPVIVQYASPYDHGVIAAGNGDIVSGIQADFYASEVQDFAFNVTNISDKPITLQAGFYGVLFGKFKLDRTNSHHLVYGIEHYRTEFFDPTAVAAADGSLTADVLTPNPGGVWKLAPKETRQIFISVQAPEKQLTSQGVFMIKNIDNAGFEPLVVPVKFNTIAPQLPAAAKPITTGWDVVMPDIAAARPEYTRKHLQMLQKYHFNMTMLSGLRYLPRPQADKNGNIIGKMDFSLLHRLIAMTGTIFDHYYLDIGVWEKNWQRKDLFGLDFYDPAFEKAFKGWFAAVADELAKLGIPNERLVVCPVDEALDKRPQMIARWIKEMRPETRIIVDTSSSDLSDVWTSLPMYGCRT